MKPYDIKKKAEEFGIMPEASVAMRLRYLVDTIGELYEIDDEVAEVYMFRAVDEIIAIKASLKRWDRKDKITDEMIERARNYPVSRLIEFRHGKAIAWCHDDKNPSLYHATRSNRANCPVCDKSFDAIGIMTERDGYSFAAAVAALQ